MKKPVPRDPPASIDATAGITRLTTSSSDEVGEGSTTTAAGTGVDGCIGPALDTMPGISANGRSVVTAPVGVSITAAGAAAGAVGAGTASPDSSGNPAAAATAIRPMASMV